MNTDWFKRGWILAESSKYLGEKKMAYAAFRRSLYEADKRHPKLAVVSAKDGMCRASIQPNRSPREQFEVAWGHFSEWRASGAEFEFIAYLPSRKTVLVEAHANA